MNTTPRIKKLNLKKLDIKPKEVEPNTQPTTPTTDIKHNKHKNKLVIYISSIICIAIVLLLTFRNNWKSHDLNSLDNTVTTTQEANNGAQEREKQIAQLATNGFILIEGGTFTMGSDKGGEDERPIHEENVKSFYLNKYEVSQSKWQSVMGYNPSYFNGVNQPVEMVSWFDAINFCNALSEQEGLQTCYTIHNNRITFHHESNGYRLPTETEWEYAARGGNLNSHNVYSGSNIAKDVAWYNNNSSQTTHNVGLKTPNILGLYDMSGNVYEWCANCYTPRLVTNADDMLNELNTNERVCRGGSFRYGAEYCRTTFRSNKTPNTKENRIGFRIARNHP